MNKFSTGNSQRRNWFKIQIYFSILLFLVLAKFANATANTTICRIQSASSYCSDTPPADEAKKYGNYDYRDLIWVNLNKTLSSISVDNNKVWGLDSTSRLWFLPNFKDSTSNWIKVAAGVKQISARNNLICQVNSNKRVYCSISPDPASRPPDQNGYQSIKWLDTGAYDFKQVAVSAGAQMWGIDSNNNLIQIKDVKNFAGSSTYVAAGVAQVAVDGNGMVCQINGDGGSYCSSWGAPSTSPSANSYYGLNWTKLNSSVSFIKITAADGKLYGVDGNGDLWFIPNYLNDSTWYRITNIGLTGASISAASMPSKYNDGSFAANEVAVLAFMGQSNSVGINTMPQIFVAPSFTNVFGVDNKGWNYLPGNKNGVIPFYGAINSIQSISWTNWSSDGSKNLGFNNITGHAANAANFAAFRWQNLINAGWKLPDLYIAHIAWPSQGVDILDTTTSQVSWTVHGVNLWQPKLTAENLPSYALAPFARTVLNLGIKTIISNGKVPRFLGLQWNQWEAEGGQSVTINNAPQNYTNLVNYFNLALGDKLNIQFVKPLALLSSTIKMQKVFIDLVATDPINLSLIDLSSDAVPLFSNGVWGGGDAKVHYDIDAHIWFANQSLMPCLVNSSCGKKISTLPSSWK
jgi:hypothetical protein